MEIRKIEASVITETVKKLYMDMNYNIGSDILDALKKAQENESSPVGKNVLEQLIEKMSVNPAKILGINAGTLSVGAPADIALIDLNEHWTVDVDKLHGKSKNTPFKNLTMTGKVKRTVLGGKTVFLDN